MNPDGRQNRKSPEDRRDHAFGETGGIFPQDVARRVFGTDTGGSQGGQGEPACGRADLAKIERQWVVSYGGLPVLEFPVPGLVDAKGTEHSVRFRGNLVEKHQHSDGWIPSVTKKGMICVVPSCPSEYLRRQELQNALFGDDIRIVGLTRANRFAISQPTLKGGEPSEIEIRKLLEEGGWRRVPITLQDLPHTLMGSAWWHAEEGLVLVDARKPNFKKSAAGVILPIDLILADLDAEMRHLLEAG
ncbi:MAG: hypothetical protein EOP85_09820 [Verrucomicrobiaceae bacterium]|nr:MAG: hypothetical protein EOP85_09820 [Verrucomicrobiaceae bacterium]